MNTEKSQIIINLNKKIENKEILEKFNSIFKEIYNFSKNNPSVIQVHYNNEKGNKNNLDNDEQFRTFIKSCKSTNCTYTFDEFSSNSQKKEDCQICEKTTKFIKTIDKELSYLMNKLSNFFDFNRICLYEIPNEEKEILDCLLDCEQKCLTNLTQFRKNFEELLPYISYNKKNPSCSFDSQKLMKCSLKSKFSSLTIPLVNEQIINISIPIEIKNCGNINFPDDCCLEIIITNSEGKGKTIKNYLDLGKMSPNETKEIICLFLESSGFLKLGNNNFYFELISDKAQSNISTYSDESNKSNFSNKSFFSSNSNSKENNKKFCKNKLPVCVKIAIDEGLFYENKSLSGLGPNITQGETSGIISRERRIFGTGSSFFNNSKNSYH